MTRSIEAPRIGGWATTNPARPRRLLIYTENHAVGGSERFVVDLARGLDPRAYRMTVAWNRGGELDRWLRHRLPAHVETRRVPVRACPHAHVPPDASLRVRAAAAKAAARRALALPGNWSHLRALIREVRPDVVHVNNGGWPGAESCRLAAIAARVERVPRVVQFVHAYPAPPHWPRAVDRTLDRRALAAVDAWITGAQGSADALKARLCMDPRRVTAVHLGQSPDLHPSPEMRHRARADLGIPADADVIALVGYLEPGKGHELALEALALLRRTGVAPRAVIAGAGRDAERLRRRCHALRLDDQVAFLGWRDDIDRVLDASDLLVHPSVDSELLPYAIKEAMAHSLPVVATEVGAVRELVEDGTTGTLVRAGDAQALANAIRALLADSARRRSFGDAGRRRLLTRFSPDEMIRRLKRVYDGCADAEVCA